MEWPDLMQLAPNAFPKDVITRAKELHEEIGSIGAYSHSQGVPLIRQNVAKFIQGELHKLHLISMCYRWNTFVLHSELTRLAECCSCIGWLGNSYWFRLRYISSAETIPGQDPSLIALYLLCSLSIRN